jgi:hypothetical protein
MGSSSFPSSNAQELSLAGHNKVFNATARKRAAR